MKPYIFIIGVFIIVIALLIIFHPAPMWTWGKQSTDFDSTTFQPIIDHSKIPANDTVSIDSLSLRRDIVNEFTPVLAAYKTNQRSFNCDSLKKLNDSLLTQLFIAKYRVERVKYYVRICQRNPKQKKFLLSWVHRAVN